MVTPQIIQGVTTDKYIAISSLAVPDSNNIRITLIKEVRKDELEIIKDVASGFFGKPIPGAMMFDGVTVKGHTIQKMDKHQFIGQIVMEGARIKPYSQLTAIQNKFAVHKGGNVVLSASDKILYHEMGAPVIVATEVSTGYSVQINNKEELLLVSSKRELFEFILNERKTDKSLLAKKKFTPQQKEAFLLQVEKKFNMVIGSDLIIS